jgi:hypothetical protein
MAQQGHRRADALEFQARRVNGANGTLTFWRARWQEDHGHVLGDIELVGGVPG